MPRIPKATAVLLVTSWLAVPVALSGCSGAVPDEPAKLTPDQEQEILQQVEQASAGEKAEIP